MLNLSPQSVAKQVSALKLSALQQVDLPSGQSMFRRWLLVLFIISAVILFMPWTQNFRAKGNVTSLNPADRPQTVQATIPGRIEHWYMSEGDTVQFGDTIARLSEIKSDYFDPELVERTEEMRAAKENSAENYLVKAENLTDQIINLREQRDLKIKETENKLVQSRNYVSILVADRAQQVVQVNTAENQEQRTDSLYNLGLKSLNALQEKQLKTQEAVAKLVAIDNKLEQARTEVESAQIRLNSVRPEYNGKINKAESDRQSALTAYYASVGDVAKLKNTESNYRIRRNFQFILAPQDGIIGTVLTPGIGETVKEGEAVVTILPRTFEPAVEMFVEPFNLPLVSKGNKVRFLFDGWPAIFFSGWPGLSYGTFVGEVVAIENVTDGKGRYRVLVSPSYTSRPWPEALRPGSGADGVALLSDVPVWYEVWRQLNAFPPDYYNRDEEKAKEEELKTKAPVKTVVK